jgi:hypothetical protein
MLRPVKTVRATSKEEVDAALACCGLMVAAERRNQCGGCAL